MRIAFLVLLGLLLGAILGGVIGIGVGLACVAIFNVSDFEGGSGMMVFLAFMPLGAVIGAIGGATSFGMLAARAAKAAREAPASDAAMP
jgi:hypothetical protein